MLFQESGLISEWFKTWLHSLAEKSMPFKTMRHWMLSNQLSNSICVYFLLSHVGNHVIDVISFAFIVINSHLFSICHENSEMTGYIHVLANQISGILSEIFSATSDAKILVFGGKISASPSKSVQAQLHRMLHFSLRCWELKNMCICVTNIKRNFWCFLLTIKLSQCSTKFHLTLTWFLLVVATLTIINHDVSIITRVHQILFDVAQTFIPGCCQRLLKLAQQLF
mmetsp:Transcript_22607/g.47159  ORF Transcript_22607/g.47159 Transcript_22607/m.47159 type:complete len:225 (+) Transcript_22607:564-1238(+)